MRHAPRVRPSRGRWLCGRAAQACAEKCGISNVVLAALSAEEATQFVMEGERFTRLEGLSSDSFNFQTLLVDPPRSGLDQHSLALAKSFDNVLYVSCNPAKLALDLDDLPEHTVVDCAMFDQFPWTNHAEVAVHLQRKVGENCSGH